MQEIRSLNLISRFGAALPMRLNVQDLWHSFIGALAMQRSEAFLWAPVCMGVGIIVYFMGAREPSALWGPGIILAVLGVYRFARPYEVLRFACLALLCVACGFSAAALRTHSVYTPILQKKMAPVQVSGTVESLEYFPGENGVRAVLGAVRIEKLGEDEMPRRVRISFRNGEGLSVGAHIEVLAGLNPPSPPVLPGGFDFQRYMFFKGIGAVGFAYGAPRRVEERGNGGLLASLQALRTRIALNAVQKSAHNGGVAAALLVGQRTAITEDDQEAMRGAGLAHMLAISGLHIGLFFGFVFFIVRFGLALIPRLALRYPIKKYAAMCAMLATVCYMFLAGAGVPTQRAVLMTGVVFAAILLDRSPISMRLVAFAAIVILLIAPESLLSASFQMSFGAVAGLVAFYGELRPVWSRLYRKAGRVRRVGLYVLGVSITSVVATLATAGFTLYHFQQLAVYGLPANILAMPILAFVVMPFAVLHFLLMPFGMERIALSVMGWGIGLILDVAHFVSGLDHAVLYGRVWSGFALALFSAGFVMLVLLKGRLRIIAAIAFILCVIEILYIKQPDILISSSSKLMAIRQDNGSLLYSDLQKERF
ncbi:MAG: ComEC/Rec2 family competence protein, partial [Alphaproteobacteria bacterium]|nr:ComEC/Rec2 family competence protein [Alphaproteobacteria bacterium]